MCVCVCGGWGGANRLHTQIFLPIDAKKSLPLTIDAFVPLQHWDVLLPEHDESLAEYAR